MAYEGPGAGPIDYHQGRYGQSRLLCRGPRRDTKGTYYAFIGGSETYGKYVERPFVDLTEEAKGQTCINFGAVNAGVDAFVQDHTMLDLCSYAKRTVVQIMGAQNMSNRFYSVHPRRNDRFLKASPLMETLFRELDFSEFTFTRHLLSTIAGATPDKFPAVVMELQEAWVARMTRLLVEIKGSKTLLWVSTHAPCENWHGLGHGADPLFVTAPMIDRVAKHASNVVEVVLPPELAPGHLEDLSYPNLEIDAAREMLGAEAHFLKSWRRSDRVDQRRYGVE